MKKYTAFPLLIIVCLFISCSQKTSQEEVSKPPEEPLSDKQISETTETAITDEEKYASTLDFAEFGDLDQKPSPIHVVTPSYPVVLFNENIEGSATLVFVVNKSGLVEDIQEESSTHPEFAQYAIDALSLWKFPILTKDGKPVKVKLRLTFPFVIAAQGEQSATAETAPSDDVSRQ